MSDVNFLATWAGFLRVFTEDRNLISSASGRGPLVAGRCSVGRSSSVVRASSHWTESVLVLVSRGVEIGVKGREDWEFRTWDKEGELVIMGLASLLVSFLEGEGDFRGTKFGLSGRRTGFEGFRVEITSAKVREGAGGEPHIGRYWEFSAGLGVEGWRVEGWGEEGWGRGGWLERQDGVVRPVPAADARTPMRTTRTTRGRRGDLPRLADSSTRPGRTPRNGRGPFGARTGTRGQRGRRYSSRRSGTRGRGGSRAGRGGFGIFGWVFGV